MTEESTPTVSSGGGRDRAVALNLMRLALPLLDAAGEVAAAIYLQHAVDVLEYNPPLADVPDQ